MLAHPQAQRRPWPAAEKRPTQEPILIPKLRIQFADFPYHTFFYQLEALHLGDLMRFTVRSSFFISALKEKQDFQGTCCNFQIFII